MTQIAIDAAPAIYLSQEILQTALSSAAARALFVPAWALRRLIVADAPDGLPATGPRIAAYALSTERLSDLARDTEIPLLIPGGSGAPITILLARPEPEFLENTTAADALLYYWRLLFHARVRAKVAGALSLAAGTSAAPSATKAAASDAPVQRRIHIVGRSLFSEVRFILVRDRFLSTTADDLAAYAEFVALYLDLTYFNPRALPAWFPAVADHDALRLLLDADVSAEALLANTRPPGASDPASRHPDPDQIPAPAPPAKLAALAKKDAPRVATLLDSAKQADAVGNDVRAAIFRMRACRTGPPEAASVYADSRTDLDELVSRLSPAIHLDAETGRAWRAALGELLDNAAGGWWNTEGRLLYDLQKVCVYHEREIYSVNVVDYCLERGKRPLNRPQPAQRLVLTLKSLRSALARTESARISSRARAALRDLINHAAHGIEKQLRASLRPRIESALSSGGLIARTTIESVAREKLIDELLDTLLERGYLRFSDVRDAVSRNQIKLDDLSGNDFFRGDALLRTDRALEQELDYVYHRGEIYLRGFHRLSATFFATPPGRLITKLAVLPVGGAYLILEGLDHTLGKLILKAGQGKTEVVRTVVQSAAETITPSKPAHATHEAVFTHWWSLALLAVFLLGIINLPSFRRMVVRGFKLVGRGLHTIFIKAPRWLLTRPAVLAIVRSRSVRAIARYTIKPLLFAAVVWLFVPDTTPVVNQLIVTLLAFIGINLILNSPAGRLLEQEALHIIRTTVARYGWEFLVAIGRAIMHLFGYLLETLDRFLYAVDELLRFRAGQSRAAVVAKAILGVFWFYIAYFTRLAINLLIEPQVNPIKHFPVVTVSHKLLFPTIFPLQSIFVSFGFDTAAALTYATGIIWCIPGIFGFLAWEFKENWKLYRANRSHDLKPVKVGSHGETVGQLLRPGFHSGTLPKAFARLRKLASRPDAPPLPTSRASHTILHAAHALHALVDRNLLALLNGHPLFAESALHLKSLEPSATQIKIKLSRDEASHLSINLEQRYGWILASVSDDTLTSTLTPDRRSLLSAALLGFYKLAGVDIIEQQVIALLQLPRAQIELRKREMIVWPTPDFTAKASYPLFADGPLIPETSSSSEAEFPRLSRTTILLSSVPFPRGLWNALWEQTSTAQLTPLPLFQIFPTPLE